MQLLIKVLRLLMSMRGGVLVVAQSEHEVAISVEQQKLLRERVAL